MIKKTVIVLAVSAVVLTGCATGTSDYERYAQAQEAIAIARSAAETAKYEALKTIALKGDSGASVAAAMGIALGNTGGTTNREPQMLQPRSTADKLLPWASLLVPSLTQFYSIQQNTDVQLRHSDNSLAGKKSDNSMIVDLVQGRIPPIIGTEDDVLLYPTQ